MTIDYDRLGQIWDDHGVMSKLKARYLKRIQKHDWEATLKEIYDVLGDPDYLLNSYEVEEFDEDPQVRIYIGSVMSIWPSGKYYTPWALSNVTAKEALKDEIWGEALEEELDRRGLYMTSGEGDPTDIFFCKSFDKSEWKFPVPYNVHIVIELVRKLEQNIVDITECDNDPADAEKTLEKLKTLIK